MLVFSRFFLPFLAALFLLISSANAQTSKFSPDQKGLLEAALRASVVEEKNLENYAQLNNPKKIVLLDKMVSLTKYNEPPVYITEEVVPEFDKVKFKLKSEAGLKKAKPCKDLLFLRVASIDQPEDDYGIVSVLAQWKLGKKSLKQGYNHRQSRGSTMLFKKINGKWQYQKTISAFPNLIDFDPGS